MQPGYPVVDLHEDLALYYMLHGGGQGYEDLGADLPGRQADIPKYRRGNVRLVFASIFPGFETFSPSETERARRIYGVSLPGIVVAPSIRVVWEQVKIYRRLAEHYKLVMVESRSVLTALFSPSEWRLGLLLHLEGADPLTEPYDLELLYRLGLRSIGLTWNVDNRYAASITARRDYGLTGLGEELVRTANRLGVVVDLAHASRQTIIDTAQVSRKPIIVSHAAVKRIADNPRNLGDEELEAIARTGGVVGITLIPTILRRDGRPGLEDVAKHILYIVEHYGDRYVALGTDLHGLLGLRPPEGLETIDRIQNLLSKLSEMGLGDQSIKRIAYENALRVLEETLQG